MLHNEFKLLKIFSKLQFFTKTQHFKHNEILQFKKKLKFINVLFSIVKNQKNTLKYFVKIFYGICQITSFLKFSLRVTHRKFTFI